MLPVLSQNKKTVLPFFLRQDGFLFLGKRKLLQGGQYFSGKNTHVLADGEGGAVHGAFVVPVDPADVCDQGTLKTVLLLEQGDGVLKVATLIFPDPTEDVFRQLGHTENVHRHLDEFRRIIVEDVLKNEDLPAQLRNSTAVSVRLHFFIGGIMNTYQQWAEGKLSCSLEEISREIATLIQKSGADYLLEE